MQDQSSPYVERTAGNEHCKGFHEVIDFIANIRVAESTEHASEREMGDSQDAG
jgi:hypothetical protein